MESRAVEGLTHAIDQIRATVAALRRFVASGEQPAPSLADGVMTLGRQGVVQVCEMRRVLDKLSGHPDRPRSAEFSAQLAELNGLLDRAECDLLAVIAHSGYLPGPFVSEGH